MIGKARIITHEEWESAGKTLFGEDKANWQFVCPMCANIASISIAMQKWPELKGRGWAPHQECVGRYTKAGGCDWASYGLFRGPLFVKKDGKNIAVFDFCGRPFTKQQEGKS